MDALIVGAGNVGQAVSRVLTAKGWEHGFFTIKNDLDAFTRAARFAGVVFIAISTKDKGEAELSLLMRCIEFGLPVVTCAKGAFSYHFGTLKPHLSKIGFTATVGGGSGILPLAIGYPGDPIVEIRAIQNGTVNFLCWALQAGMTEEEALAEAVRKQLPEPGAKGLKKVFDSEQMDMRMKASITYNLGGYDGIVTPDDFRYSWFEESIIKELLAKRGNRFVLEIKPAIGYRFMSEPFSLCRRPWIITGSFVSDAKALFFPRLNIDEESNAISVRRRSGELQETSGLGAGSEPTAETMFADAEGLLGIV